MLKITEKDVVDVLLKKYIKDVFVVEISEEDDDGDVDYDPLEYPPPLPKHKLQAYNDLSSSVSFIVDTVSVNQSKFQKILEREKESYPQFDSIDEMPEEYPFTKKEGGFVENYKEYKQKLSEIVLEHIQKAQSFFQNSRKKFHFFVYDGSGEEWNIYVRKLKIN